ALMYHGQILNIYAIPDSGGCNITPDDGIKPNTRIFIHCHITGYRYVLGNKSCFVDDGLDTFIVVNQLNHPRKYVRYVVEHKMVMNMDRLFWNGGNSMTNRVPSSALTLMPAVYLKIFPAVNRELDFWTKRAKQIPYDELRAQALGSIAAKRFHCQGGAVYA